MRQPDRRRPFAAAARRDGRTSERPVAAVRRLASALAHRRGAPSVPAVNARGHRPRPPGRRWRAAASGQLVTGSRRLRITGGRGVTAICQGVDTRRSGRVTSGPSVNGAATRRFQVVAGHRGRTQRQTVRTIVAPPWILSLRCRGQAAVSKSRFGGDRECGRHGAILSLLGHDDLPLDSGAVAETRAVVISDEFRTGSRVTRPVPGQLPGVLGPGRVLRVAGPARAPGQRFILVAAPGTCLRVRAGSGHRVYNYTARRLADATVT
jgi:hypothetical protein